MISTVQSSLDWRSSHLHTTLSSSQTDPPVGLHVTNNIIVIESMMPFVITNILIRL